MCLSRNSQVTDHFKMHYCPGVSSDSDLASASMSEQFADESASSTSSNSVGYYMTTCMQCTFSHSQVIADDATTKQLSGLRLEVLLMKVR